MSILFIISAPSGSGKSTLVNELRRLVPKLIFSVSYTTRARRGSEQDGQEYYFVDRKTFQQMLAGGDFLEHADVFGNYYGTAKRFLEEAEKSGQDLVLDIDVQGAAQIKAKFSSAVSIFILPPSRQELEARLRRRSQAENMRSEEIIQRRLHAAGREIENYGHYDYILINDQLDDSIEKITAIVKAERLQRSGGIRSGEDRKVLARAESCKRANAEPKVKGIVASFEAARSER